MAKTNLSVDEQKELRASAFPFTKGEEIFNAVSHIVGGAFALVALVLLIIKASYSTTAVISSVIYGLSMLTMFTMSAIYHFLRKNRAKKVFRVFDQCSIFLLIAGTYTPFCLVTFNDQNVGLIMFIVVWVVSILGITLNAINMKHRAIKAFTQIAYIALGWCVVFAMSPLVKALPIAGIIWLVTGGVLYTSGVVFFALGRKVKYLHPIWHLFVLFGAMTQFVSVYFYVL